VNKLGLEKRADIVIRAIGELKDQIPDIALILAGSGPLEPELRTLAKTLGVERKVQFLGYVPHTGKLPLLFQASDVFAIMSPVETQSMTAMQAFASGIPVLGANALGLKEYIKPAVGFLIEPGNYKMLAEKILLLYKQPALRQKMGQAGRKYVLNFSIEKIAQTWEEIYESTIKRYIIEHANKLRSSRV
jgi:glycosyltransferase involved in cell wall biosynthesis